MEWLERLKKRSNGDMKVTYKAFVLEQANFESRREPGWKIWEDKNFPSRDMPALQASKCALKQGEEEFPSLQPASVQGQTPQEPGHYQSTDSFGMLHGKRVSILERFSEGMRNGAGVKEVARITKRPSKSMECLGSRR